jgi:hypothetical protein
MSTSQEFAECLGKIVYGFIDYKKLYVEAAQKLEARLYLQQRAHSFFLQSGMYAELTMDGFWDGTTNDETHLENRLAMIDSVFYGIRTYFEDPDDKPNNPLLKAYYECIDSIQTKYMRFFLLLGDVGEYNYADAYGDLYKLYHLMVN